MQNDQRLAILKAYKLKVGQEVIPPPVVAIKTCGPILKSSPNSFEQTVGGVKYTTPSADTKVIYIFFQNSIV